MFRSAAIPYNMYVTIFNETFINIMIEKISCSIILFEGSISHPIVVNDLHTLL